MNPRLEHQAIAAGSATLPILQLPLPTPELPSPSAATVRESVASTTFTFQVDM